MSPCHEEFHLQVIFCPQEFVDHEFGVVAVRDESPTAKYETNYRRVAFPKMGMECAFER